MDIQTQKMKMPNYVHNIVKKKKLKLEMFEYETKT